MTAPSPALQWAARADWIEAEDGTVVCLRPDVGYGTSWALWPQRKAMLAAAPLMYAALKAAAAQFDFYAAQHDAKGTPESATKADVNRAMAAECRAALAAAEPQS